MSPFSIKLNDQDIVDVVDVPEPRKGRDSRSHERCLFAPGSRGDVHKVRNVWRSRIGAKRVVTGRTTQPLTGQWPLWRTEYEMVKEAQN